jgi:hypothetical protein
MPYGDYLISSTPTQGTICGKSQSTDGGRWPESTKPSHPSWGYEAYKFRDIRGEAGVWGSDTLWVRVPYKKKPVAKNDGKEISFERNIAQHNHIMKTRQLPPTPMYSWTTTIEIGWLECTHFFDIPTINKAGTDDRYESKTSTALNYFCDIWNSPYIFFSCTRTEKI